MVCRMRAETGEVQETAAMRRVSEVLAGPPSVSFVMLDLLVAMPCLLIITHKRPQARVLQIWLANIRHADG